VLSLPYQEKLSDSFLEGFTMIIGGCNPQMTEAFAKNKNFWLDPVPPRNLTIDGFAEKPEMVEPDRAEELQRIAPTAVTERADALSTSDDWPFLYLHGRLIPDLTLRSVVILGLLGLGMVYFFMPRGRVALDSRMFFLGAAFMLLETRAVAQMALLFGSTWLVNSSVFFTILVLILLANLYVVKARSIDLRWHYLGLSVFLIAGAFIPLDVFLTGGILWRYVAPCFLTLSPVLFAGVIFARSFRNAPRPEFAIGSNIAGSVVGGFAEAVSMLLGFQHLLLVALAFYLLSAGTPRVQLSPARS
jgi:hypothetical protein